MRCRLNLLLRRLPRWTEVWRGIFGSADNGITIPEEDDSNNNGGFFDMTDDEGNNDPVLGG